jgi:hypothetical protein
MRLSTKTALTLSALAFFIPALFFQNCSDVEFASAPVSSGNPAGTPAPSPTPPGGLPPLTPLVDKAGVVTILLALGDQVGDQLVVAGSSAQLISETVVRYASPVNNPRILVVRDANHQGESAYDPQYISQVLLQRYNASFTEEPSGGLRPGDTAGFDVIWFNNPGHPMGSQQSLNTLLAFAGGVIVSGDDMSRGEGFSTTPLTGLAHINNGTLVDCNGKVLQIDDNEGGRYRVTMDSRKMPGSANSALNFSYGNDIDLSIADPTIEVLATARGDDPACTASRPVIVRYPK